MTLFTKFGQEIKVGDVVGWGHRNGNFSRQQVGIVLELKAPPSEYESPGWRARCYWVAGGSKDNYVSECTARDLFVLCEDSFGGEGAEIRQKIALGRRSQLPDTVL